MNLLDMKRQGRELENAKRPNGNALVVRQLENTVRKSGRQYRIRCVDVTSRSGDSVYM